jgi:ubiquitin-conjugating enzyme E2 R
VAASKSEAEKDQVVVPLTMEEYCIKPKKKPSVPDNYDMNDDLYDDEYDIDDDFDDDEEDEDEEAADDTDDSGNGKV